jgi:DHA1 family multidrug resistance protein-like MFS transporter
VELSARDERYGGDDIHEPPPKELLDGRPSPIQSDITLDANMIVTWDSPNDPSNPQNWSIKYKWFVTVVCTVMTINVYV